MSSKNQLYVNNEATFIPGKWFILQLMGLKRAVYVFLCLILSAAAFGQTCSLTVSSQKVCLGNTATFTVTSTGGTVTNISINYGDGNTNPNAAAISVYSYNAVGSFTPTVTVTFSGGATCNASAPLVTVFPLPIANYVITSEDTLCFKGNNLCILNLSTPGASNAPLNQLTWQLSNGYILNTTPVFNQQYCYANTLDVFGHLYTLVVEVRDTNNCISRLEKKDSVLLMPKVYPPEFTHLATEFCDSTVASFTNTSLMPLAQVKKIYWIFGDGVIDSNNWAATTHTYKTAGTFYPRMVLVDLNNCADTFVSGAPLVVNTLQGTIVMLTPATQCYSLNEFKFGTAVSGSVKWEVFDAGNNKVDSAFSHSWSVPGFKASNCGMFTLRMTKTLLNCQIIKDTILHVLGPKAKISNDTARTIGGNQCSIQDTVRFKTPVPYLSCHYNNPQMTRLWNFGDAFAPPCTTDTKNGINVGMNCNWSKDSMDVKHMYKPGEEGCYGATLTMVDLASGCTSRDSTTLSLTPPDAGYDSSFTPPRPRLYVETPPQPCMYTPITFNIERTLPSCHYQRAWINFDSACGANNWVEFDTIIKPRKRVNVYSSTCDSSGWITAGIIIKNGNCYDTAWYHHLFRLFPKDPRFNFTLNNTCEPFDIYLHLIDSVQYNMSSHTYGITHNYLLDSTNILLISPYTNTATTTINPGDSVITRIRFNDLPDDGIYNIISLLTDVNGCGLSTSGVIGLGYHKYIRAPRYVLCVNDTVSLLETIRYYDVNGVDYLNTRDFWKEPARAAAGKERIWWDIGDGAGFSLTGSSPVIKYNRPGNYTITMVTADSSGCFDTIVKPNFFKVVAPEAQIKSLQSQFFCAPQIVQFMDSSYVIDSSAAMGQPRFDTILQWQWLFDDNKPNSLQQNPAHNFTSNGVFNVKLIITTSVAGCVDTATIAVNMKGPQPAFDILSDTIGCAPYSVKFDNTTPKKLLNWTWYFGDNNVKPTADDSDALHTYLLPGTYKIRLQGVDTVFNPTTGNFLTCNAYFPDTNTNIPSRTIYVLPGAKASVASEDTVCVNQKVDFVVTADSLYKRFFWNFADGDTLTKHRPDTIVSKIFRSTGTFNVMMAPAANTTLACIDTVYTKVFVTSVKADFEIDDSKTPEFSFTNKSTDAIRYIWNFGDEASGAQNTSTLKDTKHLFSAAQLDTFWVCLWAYNKEDCMDSVCKPVMLGARVRIPNVFTPDNNDGTNDAFDIDIEGWTYYKINIYNRWGNEVFEGEKDGFGNDGINWNGKKYNDGAVCPAGVYYFIFTYKLVTEADPKTVHGTVTLIR